MALGNTVVEASIAAAFHTAVCLLASTPLTASDVLLLSCAYNVTLQIWLPSTPLTAWMLTPDEREMLHAQVGKIHRNVAHQGAPPGHAAVHT